MRVIKQLMEWFGKLLKPGRDEQHGSHVKGGVDAGREAFVRLNAKENEQKKNLLRKLNLYWARKKSTSQLSYGGIVRNINWRRPLLLVVCLALTVSLFVAYDGTGNVIRLMANMDYFRIAIIEVKGSVKASPNKVRNSSGIQVSTSLFSIDSAKVARTIKEQNSWVKNVEIIRRWPDALLIRVSEYEPYAMIAIGSGEYASLHYLDRQGEPFVRVGAGMDLDFPVITGLEQVDDSERSDILKESMQFLRLIRANNPNLPAQSVSELHVDQQGELVVHLVEYPFPIFFGSGNVRGKYIKLRKVLEVLYKPRKMGMKIAGVVYIKMEYLSDKVIVGYSESS